MKFFVFFFFSIKGKWVRKKHRNRGKERAKEKKSLSLTSVPSLCHVTTSVPPLPPPAGPDPASAAWANSPRALCASPPSSEVDSSCASARSAAERTAAASEEVAAVAPAPAPPAPPPPLTSAATATIRGSASRASKASCVSE